MGIIEARKKTAFTQEVNVVERFVLRVPSSNQPPVPEKIIVTVKKPMPFAYDNTHAVPWKHDTKIETVESSSKHCSEYPQQDEGIGTHIVDVGGITQSGRCYGPEGGEKRKDKEKIVEGK